MFTCRGWKAIKDKQYSGNVLFVWAYVHCDNTAFCHCEGSAKPFHNKWAGELLTRGFNRLQLSLAALPIYSGPPRWEYGISVQCYTFIHPTIVMAESENTNNLLKLWQHLNRIFTSPGRDNTVRLIELRHATNMHLDFSAMPKSLEGQSLSCLHPEEINLSLCKRLYFSGRVF